MRTSLALAGLLLTASLVVAADPASAECVELEWDHGYTDYVCVLGGGPHEGCDLFAVGQYGSASSIDDAIICLDDELTR